METFNPIGSRHQGGVTALMFIMTVVGLLALSGMVLDVGLLYHRRQELDLMARTVAVAAAGQLNGNSAGIDKALEQGADALRKLSYRYGTRTPAWRDDMLSFGPAADGSWRDAAGARSGPAGLTHVRADTARLDAPVGSVTLFIMRLLSPRFASMAVATTAVAARTGIDVLPLALCAMSSQPGAARTNPGPPVTVELVEYGFRRGVAYDLMQLNPHGIDPANFLVDPFRAPGQAGAASAAAAGTPAASAVGPYVCTGQLAFAPLLAGAALKVAQPFPLALLYRQLNSRFGQYDSSVCSAATAMVDRNPKSYQRDQAVPWMSAMPDEQGAQTTTTGNQRRTIADLAAPPAGVQARMYGPLWAYARAVPFSAWSAGADEPAGGYPSFGPGDWASLYGPSAPAAKNYPGATPYLSTSGANYQLPPVGQKGQSNRRVLHVPLLACPVTGSGSASASMLAVAKFLMTVPATPTALYAEFGGLAPVSALGGPVELVR
ncbi:hypothetical protein ASF61_15025 [Duganella sp. Leaf126]|uniref:hypothetical protein n=1 Tax=Duganella sp. Leaf126 TaxID=1736266 RepID=UPI0006FBBB46|nr:hypothetical protein [Duganella sp. Leaf126]KQQ32355.1 hypothetical protein ASF61_15025 [Duganella sp. Leaf126]